jgi:hypothetical protein
MLDMTNIPDVVYQMRTSIIVKLIQRYGAIQALGYMNQLAPLSIGPMTKLQLMEDMRNDN